jgi:putative ABC transport system permease protein
LRAAIEVNQNILTIFSFLGVIAFILSSLGLFTLVSINLIKKKKEIGVRKVLGGEISHIVFLISKGYFPLLFISSAVGVTAEYFLVDWLIASIFNNYKDMDVITFIVPIITIILISLTIAGLHTLRAATINPVNALRYE